MLLKLSPALKGFITAILMIGVALLLDKRKDNGDTRLQYLILVLYAAGIIWSLVSYSFIEKSNRKFSALFSQGFKCFIVVTLVMIVFTALFIKMHPEYAVQEAAATKEYYLKQGDKTPAEIADLAERAKKQYAITVISVSIFRYLIFGAIVTAGTAALLTRRK